MSLPCMLVCSDLKIMNAAPYGGSTVVTEARLEVIVRGEKKNKNTRCAHIHTDSLFTLNNTQYRHDGGSKT